jgi:SOS-response transcriptional repressor LexA
MANQEQLKKLAELENKEWADRALAEIRSHTNDYEYQIIFKTEEAGFFSAIAELTAAGYSIIPNTTLFQNEAFVVLMKRDKAK